MAKFIECKDASNITVSINIDHIILFRPFALQGDMDTQLFLTDPTYNANKETKYLIVKQNYPTIKKAISDALK